MQSFAGLFARVRSFAGRPFSGRRFSPAHLLHSIKLRMVLVFLVLAAALVFVFIGAVRQVVASRWELTAEPLLVDYVDRLAEAITVDGHPGVERAQALAGRLPLTVRIEGPVVQWTSHPGNHLRASESSVQRPNHPVSDAFSSSRAWEGSDERSGPPWDEPPSWRRIRQITERETPDGHRIIFGIDTLGAQHHGPGFPTRGLIALLLLTLLAWWYVHRTLRPLDAISAGARRFGQGSFAEPIPATWTRRRGELGELAATINTMGEDIRQMLDAKRSLLLAISHEMRSPLTRARLHAELLPEDDPEVLPQRQALLRDLREMSALVEDLLESERLTERHVALQREPLDPAAVARSAVAEVRQRHPDVAITLQEPGDMSLQSLDGARLRLLLRNLLENAVRHGRSGPVTAGEAGSEIDKADAAQPGITVSVERVREEGCCIEVRDHGPGVPEEELPKLTEPFHRPDAARSRRAGGVGLGLHLCRLVARAHGGTLTLENAYPGLRVRVWLPPAAADSAEPRC